ncbi:hypothetical protein C8R45DRAFT_1091045 [Mycena sanguinolenta]|nr:hypothetical protein C8R45DRAFT_1091045 [Mycena sanguinolenta]
MSSCCSNPGTRDCIFFFVLGEMAASLVIVVFLGVYSPVSIVGWLDFLALCFSLFVSKTGKLPGKLDFFSGCDLSRTNLNYTAWNIMFGFHPLEPLVRGESVVIVAIRTFLLICLSLGIPAFGFYVVVLVPMLSQAMTRDVKISQSWLEWDWHLYDPDPANITIIFRYIRDSPSEDIVCNVTTAQGCPTTNVAISDSAFTAVTCPFPWDSAVPGGIVLSANFTDPWGILYVKAGQGDPNDVDAYTEPIPLVSGAHLTAILGTTQRKTFSNSAIDFLGLTTPLRTIMLKSILHLQSDPSTQETTNTVTLRLRPRSDLPAATRVVEDFTDASVLAGFASFGGFWTFTNGTFAMLFGANLLFFLLKKRPLSALGLVHVFQKRALIRNWTTDFPTSHTEGGLPGSEAAGIVAFLRERFVDVVDPYFKAKEGDIQGDDGAQRLIQSERVASDPNQPMEETEAPALEHIPLQIFSDS